MTDKEKITMAKITTDKAKIMMAKMSTDKAKITMAKMTTAKNVDSQKCRQPKMSTARDDGQVRTMSETTMAR